MANQEEADLFVALYPFKTDENNQLSLQKGKFEVFQTLLVSHDVVLYF